MILGGEFFIPDGDEARGWAEEELSRTIYQEARPTAFDRWAQGVAEFLLDLFTGEGGGSLGPWGVILAGAIILAALIAALLFWGLPRRSRALPRTRVDLLGDSDDRTAAQLRADAERSARSGAWAEATILCFRALARGLLERDLIDPAPGATAHAIAREAASAFASEAAALETAATLFDEVRYLERPGAEEHYRLVAELDERMRREQPELVTT